MTAKSSQLSIASLQHEEYCNKERNGSFRRHFFLCFNILTFLLFGLFIFGGRFRQQIVKTEIQNPSEDRNSTSITARQSPTPLTSPKQSPTHLPPTKQSPTHLTSPKQSPMHLPPTKQSPTHLPSNTATHASSTIQRPRTNPTNTKDEKKTINITRTPEQCYDYFLGPTRADDLAKIESYKFDKNNKYIQELFPSSSDYNKTKEFPKNPTVVCGISSNHFEEGIAMLKMLNKTVRGKYADIKVVAYDIGLSNPQVEQLKVMNFVEVRKFDFTKYPKHVRALRNFAWKAIITKIVASESHFVIYMDTSIRFKTNDLDGLFKKVQDKGILVSIGEKTSAGTITERTHSKTFEFLAEQLCTYAFRGEAVGGFYLLYSTPFVMKYFLYPYVACALTLGCMEPVEGGSDRFINCGDVKKRPAYHYCHRSDQSVIGILYHRLFHMDFEQNRLEDKYFAVCRDTREMC